MRKKKGFIIICGPSGVGKSTLIRNVISEMSSQLSRIVSYTTRKKREGEKHGKDYFFISKKEFFEKVDGNEFTEWAHVYDHYSATSKEQVESIWKEGRVIIKDVDLQGLKSIKKIYPQSLAIGIFTSRLDEIERRIKKRATEEGIHLEIRLKDMEFFIQELKKLCLVHIYNDDIQKADRLLKKEIEKYIESL